MSDLRRIEVGRLGAAHGVRGWLRVQSFTDPPQRLFEWKRWRLQSGAEVNVLEARPQGNGWIAQLEGIEDRDAAGFVHRDRVGPTVQAFALRNVVTRCFTRSDCWAPLDSQ